MPETMTYVGELTITSCWCGIHVAVPADLYWQARDGKQSIYCPIGHTFIWGPDALDRERAARERAERELARERARRDQAEAEAREERERLSAARAEVQRTRRRAAAGVCPCCNRSFVQLARHMASKHPDVASGPELPPAIVAWSRVAAVVEVVTRSDEPLTYRAVHGRLVLAGRRDTAAQVRSALHNATNSGRGIKRVARSTWARA